MSTHTLEGDKQLSPIEHLNTGLPLIVDTPYGLRVILQKSENKLRSAVLGNGELTSEQFNAIVAENGGINAIVSEVLDAIGFTKKTVPGSGTLIARTNDLRAHDALNYFSFPKK